MLVDRLEKIPCDVWQRLVASDAVEDEDGIDELGTVVSQSEPAEVLRDGKKREN
jgi:hypothetical protein